FFFFSSRRRHTRCLSDWSSDVCSSGLQRKIDICSRAYELSTRQANFPANDIIFDPNILTIATGLEEHRNYAVDFLEATRWIKRRSEERRVGKECRTVRGRDK